MPTRNSEPVPDVFKQNFIQWFIGFLTVVIVGSLGWVLNISNNMAKMQSSMQEIARIREDHDKLDDFTSEVRVLKTEVESVKGGREEAQDRMDLHSDRLTRHGDEPYHQEAGIMLGRLEQRMNALEREFDHMLSTTISPMKSKLEEGKRYTLEMAMRDEERILSTLDKIADKQDAEIDRLTAQIARSENAIHLEIGELRNTLNAILGTKEPVKLLMNAE